jgi:predicted PurR-regulated permease PerM
MDNPRKLRTNIGMPIGSNSLLGGLSVAVIVVAALYFARELFVPLALAILLSFAISPLVLWLRRWHFRRVPSVITSVLLAFAVIFGIGSVIGGQIAQLAEDLPVYQDNIVRKLHSLQGSKLGDGLIGRSLAMLKTLGKEVERAPQGAEPGAGVTPSLKPSLPQRAPPIPVEIHQPELTAVQVIQTLLTPVLQPLATTGLVIIFVVFFLLQREDLRSRFLRLAGSRDLQRTTAALDDAGSRLSRYLLIQTALNAGFGLLIGAGLGLIGVPNPVLWGVLAMLLRFVPYIGPIIAALFPMALAVAVDPGWSMLLWVTGLFLVVEPLTGHVIEPQLYGRGTGLSAVAVIVSAAFWTWLWGPIGLLLSTPLTVCLIVLGRHVDRLEFLDVLLGNEPALTPDQYFYQRILGGDPDEAALHAEAFLKSSTLAAYYDEVAIKGLALAQLDVNRGELDHAQRMQIKESVEAVMDDLAEHRDATPTAATSDQPSPTEKSEDTPVLCAAGRGSLDEAAAALLAQLLIREGIGARVVSSSAVSALNISGLDVVGVEVVCLSYLEPGGLGNARYLVRRMRRKSPNLRILIGFWSLDEAQVIVRDAVRETGADGVVTSLQQAVAAITAIVRNQPAPSVE